MSARATIVVGANFGDEGKGKMVDYACRQQAAKWCVRFNGGAQAGHTVQTAAARHVFHHLGAGTLAGAMTFLTENFAVNPILLLKELAALPINGVPEIMVDPRAPITTPWDMIINQAVEDYRSGERHGSCGVGFNETIERDQHEPFRLRVVDLWRPDSELLEICHRIRSTYATNRLNELGVPQGFAGPSGFMISDLVLHHFARQLRTVFPLFSIFAEQPQFMNESVVFEGAQGLMLDQDSGNFPYVTRSSTGVKNALAFMSENHMDQPLEVVYVTRWCLTRHGAGPLAHEIPQPSGVADETNVTNRWQGQLRFGLLDVDALADRINADFALAAGRSPLKSIALTCLDQMQVRGVDYVQDGEVRNSPIDSLISILLQRVGNVDVLYLSEGPTAKDVMRVSTSDRGSNAKV
jgi:adenylosuccinate synthase